MEHAVRRRIGQLVVVVSCIGAIVALPACRPLTGPDGGSAVTTVDAYLRSHDFSGVVLIAQAEHVLLHEAYGMANVAAGEPNRLDTRYPIMSVTKPITAVAALQLSERGLLDLDEPLTTYLPDFPRGSRITVQQLLTHTSGLPPDLLPIPAVPAPVSEAFDDVDDQALLFEPGAGYAYSNVGYQLLALLIEQQSGQPFDTYLQEHIFAQLDMRRSGVATMPLLDDALPRGYDRAGSELVETATFNDAAATRIGAGGVYSTVEDLYRWEAALHDGSLLSAPSYERMLTAEPSGYAYSWRVLGPDKAIWHTGSDEGFFSIVFRDIEHQVVIVAMSNVRTDEQRIYDLLGYYEASHQIQGSPIYRFLLLGAASLAAFSAAWLALTARRLRRGTRQLQANRWWRIGLQAVVPVVIGVLAVYIASEPWRAIGSWEITRLVAPAFPRVLAAAVAALILATTVALHTFVGRPQRVDSSRASG